ncbi:MAG: serine/threonine protein kinase, partial [Cyanobacteria bacterium J06642_2]
KSLKASPCERFQSALEMRRALESLTLYGYWTIDSQGLYIGYLNNQAFRFERERNHSGIKFTAFRKYLDSGIERKITRYSVSRLTELEAEKKTKDFMLAVVNGNL